MQYQIALIIHLFCAIIFIGFVFADVVILPTMKKVLSNEEHQKVMNTISSRARKIFPLSVLAIILSGGYMLSTYMNSQIGFLNSNLQILLFIKIILALIIVTGILYSLGSRLLKRNTHPIMKHFHKFVLICGICIVLLAKFMFIF